MKNFFDIATPEEMAAQFSDDNEPLDARTIATERQALDKDADANLVCLAFLFADRSDFANAETCLDSMSDELLRADTGRMIAHDPAYLDWCAKRAA